MGRRIYRMGRSTIIWLPLFLFLCAVVLPFVPGAMGMFSDSAGPWYQQITSGLFVAALCYAYPMTWLCTRIGGDQMFLSPGYYLVLALYTAAWMFLLRTLFVVVERRRKNPI